VAQAAAALGLAPSTLHRWLGDGFIAGQQTTAGAPVETSNSTFRPKYATMGGCLRLEPVRETF
jgi:hypothetical protein